MSLFFSLLSLGYISHVDFLKITMLNVRVKTPSVEILSVDHM